jgi:hypothetical protein
MTTRSQNRHLKPAQPGEVRNPAGRPKGSKHKLSALGEPLPLQDPERDDALQCGDVVALPLLPNGTHKKRSPGARWVHTEASDKC